MRAESLHSIGQCPTWATAQAGHSLNYIGSREADRRLPLLDRYFFGGGSFLTSPQEKSESTRRPGRSVLASTRAPSDSTTNC